MSVILPPITAGPIARHRNPASVVESSGVVSWATAGTATKVPSRIAERKREMRMRGRVGVGGRLACTGGRYNNANTGWPLPVLGTVLALTVLRGAIYIEPVQSVFRAGHWR